jgi:hypothetical protein
LFHHSFWHGPGDLNMASSTYRGGTTMTQTPIAANAMSEKAREALASCSSLRNMHDVAKKLISDKQLGLDFDPKRNNAFEMPVSLLVCDMKDSIREKLDSEQIRSFAEAYMAGEHVDALSVVAENGTLRVVASFHRYFGLMEALSKGATIKRVWVNQLEGGRRAEVLRQLVSQQSVPHTPLELARGYRELLEDGMTVQEIADSVHKGVDHVKRMLELGQAEPGVQDLVAAGVVKPTTAIAVSRKCKAEGTSATTELKNQLSVAHSNGSATITPKSTGQAAALYSRKDMENTLPALLALAEQLEKAVPFMGEIPQEVKVTLTLNGELTDLLRSLANIRAAHLSTNPVVNTAIKVG